MNDKLCLSPFEASQKLGIGKNTLYRFIASGELPSFKIGSRRLINLESLDQLRQKLESQHTKEIRGG